MDTGIECTYSLDIIEAAELITLFEEVDNAMKSGLSKRSFAIEKSWFEKYQRFVVSIQSVLK